MVILIPDVYHQEARKGVLKILEIEKVAYRNELEYRLENPNNLDLAVKKIYHPTTDSAIRELEAEGKIKRTNVSGRKGKGIQPNVFYKLPGEEYDAIVPLMEEKLELSNFLIAQSSDAGLHSQRLWREALESLGFSVLDENVREFEGKMATVGNDVDYVIERDGVRYGVEVKNTLAYPTDLALKFQVAVEIGVLPFFIVRMVTSPTFERIRWGGGLVKIYETAIFSSTFSEIIEKCRVRLGAPVISLDSITEKTKNHVLWIHEHLGLKEYQDRMKSARSWLERRYKTQELIEELKNSVDFG